MEHALLGLLAERGYPDKELGRLGELVKTAKTVVGVTPAPTNDVDRQKALLEGYRWISDWAACARLVITKKGLLIALGLASKKKSKKAVVEPPAPTQVPATADAAKGKA